MLLATAAAAKRSWSSLPKGGGGSWVRATHSASPVLASAVTTRDIGRDRHRVADPFCQYLELVLRGLDPTCDMKGADPTGIRKRDMAKVATVHVEDSDRGFIDSTRLLIWSYFGGPVVPKFDYSAFKPKVYTFLDDRDAGPKGIQHLHRGIESVLDSSVLVEIFAAKHMVDLFHLIDHHRPSRPNLHRLAEERDQRRGLLFQHDGQGFYATRPFCEYMRFGSARTGPNFHGVGKMIIAPRRAQEATVLVNADDAGSHEDSVRLLLWSYFGGPLVPRFEYVGRESAKRNARVRRMHWRIDDAFAPRSVDDAYFMSGSQAKAVFQAVADFHKDSIDAQIQESYDMRDA